MKQNKEHQSISYKGCSATLRWSKEDGCYYGKIENASDLISFEGDTEEKAETAFREAVDDYIVLAIVRMIFIFIQTVFKAQCKLWQPLPEKPNR